MGKINRPPNSKERDLCAAFFHWEILGYLDKKKTILSDTLSKSEAKFAKKTRLLCKLKMTTTHLNIRIVTVNALKPKTWGVGGGLNFFSIGAKVIVNMWCFFLH